ncbi:MAG: hypothetical protein LBF05_02140, partial [Tannerella sp.]|nr:hypothetical protein [Tannerella sp.]
SEVRAEKLHSEVFLSEVRAKKMHSEVFLSEVRTGQVPVIANEVKQSRCTKPLDCHVATLRNDGYLFNKDESLPTRCRRC